MASSTDKLSGNYVPGGSVNPADSALEDGSAPYAVAGQNVSGYKGVMPEYRTAADGRLNALPTE